MSLSKLIKATQSRTCIAAATVLMISTGAHAQVTSRTGNITNIYLSGGNNYGFRVSLVSNGITPLSDCAGQFAYLNTNFDNYQTYSAMLSTAWVHSRTVTLITSKDAQGFCKIAETLF